MDSFDEGLLTNLIAGFFFYLLYAFYDPQQARRDALRAARWLARKITKLRSQPAPLANVISLEAHLAARGSVTADLATSSLPPRPMQQPYFADSYSDAADHMVIQSILMRRQKAFIAAIATPPVSSPTALLLSDARSLAK
jgi:hypothetical protein